MLDMVSKRRRLGARELLWDCGLDELPASAVLDEPAASGFVERALSLLCQSQREVIQMLKLEGYSVAEIARKTGRSEASVKVTAHRGYRTLRKLMRRSADDE